MFGSGVKMEANYYEIPCEKHPVKIILRNSFLILNKMEPLKGFKQRYDVMIREGNGTPLQYSCLEYPMDGGAW